MTSRRRCRYERGIGGRGTGMFRKTARAALPFFLLISGSGALPQTPQPAETELQQTLVEVQRVIAESESTPLAEDKAEWRARLSDVLRHWAEFRDARCDARLIVFEQAVGEDAADAARRAAAKSSTGRSWPTCAIATILSTRRRGGRRSIRRSTPGRSTPRSPTPSIASRRRRPNATIAASTSAGSASSPATIASLTRHGAACWPA